MIRIDNRLYLTIVIIEIYALIRLEEGFNSLWISANKKGTGVQFKGGRSDAGLTGSTSRSEEGLTRSSDLRRSLLPKIRCIYTRKRLLNEFTHAQEKPLVWVVGPPGCGKTTAVVDYLTPGIAPILWIRISSEDATPSTFFHNLSFAVEQATSLSDPLPLSISEQMGDLAVFTRLFMAELQKTIEHPCVFVFDDFHQLPHDSATQQLFYEVIDALTEGDRAFFISRESLPPWAARFTAQNTVYLIDWRSLRLDQEEAIGIARLLEKENSLVLSDEEIVQIHNNVDGWVAGEILILHALAGQVDVNAALADHASYGAVFDYFASELFDRVSTETQDFLLQSALMPSMTVPDVTELTGNAQSGKILKSLYDRNLFVTKRLTPSPVYEYHALFRDFLLEEAQQRWEPDQLNGLRQAAAKILLKAGKAEPAMELFLAAKQWREAGAIIISQAPMLVSRGRMQRLLRCLERLPSEIVQATPWLLYWLGTAQSGPFPEEAEPNLSNAFELFKERDDATGMYLCIAGVIHISWMTERNHRGLDRWLDRFDRLHARHPKISSLEVEAKVTSALLMAIFYRRPDHPLGGYLLKRARYLWSLPLETNLRWQLGSAIGFYISGSEGLIRWIKTLRLYESAKNEKSYSGPEQLHLLLSFAFVDCFSGAYSSSMESVHRGQTLARDSGIHIYDLLFLSVGVYNGLLRNKPAVADESLDRMGRILAGQSPNFNTVLYHMLRNWRALVIGDYFDAVDHGRAALTLALENGAVYPLARCHHGLALALFATGDREQALQMLDEARIAWGKGKHQQLRYDCNLAEAWFRLEMGEEDAATDLLTRALKQSKVQGWGVPIWSFPGWLEPLFVFALEREIETSQVQKFIGQTALQPREVTTIPDNWPLTIKIHALGGFYIEINGEIITSKTRAKNRPLELLKALIAYGGKEVAEEKLMDALWPDAGGDAALRSFNTTLHRLRKMLEIDHIIVLKDRTVSLDTQHVWLDTWSLESKLDELDRQLNAPHTLPTHIEQSWRSIDRLYQGPFLGKGSQNSWSIGLLERLRSRMIRMTLAVGGFWEKTGRWNLAIDAYQKGLEIDPLIEVYYQRLMLLYEHLDRPAEALATYEHCRQILAQSLSVLPGKESTKIYRQILAEVDRPPGGLSNNRDFNGG